ncbi:hypothetical protein CerSpe_087360 [Prunus speciosa]
MLNQFNVKVGALEEKVVDLGMDEGLKLLKASLETSTVLTNVFLGNKKAKTFVLHEMTFVFYDVNLEVSFFWNVSF